MADDRRAHLARLIRRFRDGAAAVGVDPRPSRTPIQPIRVGDPAAVLALSDARLDEGLLARAIRPPTVPAHGARLRVTLSAAHTEAQVDRLVEALGRVRPDAMARTALPGRHARKVP